MFATIQLPDNYLQALLRNRPEHRYQPVVVLDGSAKTSTKQDRGKARILQCSTEAREFGVHIGMTATQAQARCEFLVLLNRSSQAEEQLQRDLFAYVDSISPDYEATADGICTIDIGGIAHIQDRSRIRSLGWEMVDHFSEKQLLARVGFAANPDLAHLAARTLEFTCPNRPAQVPIEDASTGSIVEESPGPSYFSTEAHSPSVAVILSGEESRIDPFPLDILDLSPEWKELFQLWGITTIAELKKLDRSDLIERLGGEAGLIHDRASGCRNRLLELFRPVALFEASTGFDYEVLTLEPLLFVMRRLLDTIAARLTGAYLVAAEIRLRLDLANGNHYRRSFRIPEPSADVEMLLSLLHTHLDDFQAEAAITGLHIQASPARGGRHQFDFFVAGLKDPNQLAETLARLDAILGSERIGSPQLLPTHRPDSFKVVPFRPERVGKIEELSEPVRLLSGLPLRRLRPRLHVEVRCRSSPGPVANSDDSIGFSHRFNPVAILSGPLRGNIAAASGPWRSSGTWWEKAMRWRREEWDIAMENGGICRLAKDRKEWFVEGVYG